MLVLVVSSSKGINIGSLVFLSHHWPVNPVNTIDKNTRLAIAELNYFLRSCLSKTGYYQDSTAVVCRFSWFTCSAATAKVLVAVGTLPHVCLCGLMLSALGRCYHVSAVAHVKVCVYIKPIYICVLDCGHFDPARAFVRYTDSSAVLCWRAVLSDAGVWSSQTPTGATQPGHTEG